MRLLGVDPGLSNAGAAIIEVAAPDMFSRTMSVALLDVIEIPVTGDEARKRIAVQAFDAWLRKWRPEHCGIERAQSMTYFDKVTGTRRAQAHNFVYGRAVGAIEATVLLGGAKLYTVEPSVWKRTMGLQGGTDKKRLSIALATKLFPQQAHFFARVRDHNVAEAALIAKFTADQLLLPALEKKPAKRGNRGKAA